MLLGELFPDFKANTTDGPITFHDWIGDSWAILFSHPHDFTPVCTTELARVIKLMPDFKSRNVKVIGLSCDTLESHKGWIEDIKAVAGETEMSDFPYPIIDDHDHKLAESLGMIDTDEIGSKGKPVTARAVFIVDPNKKFRLSFLYPATTGRNFDEVLRVIDSLQLTDNAHVATPADWKMGQDLMVLPSVKECDLPDLFPAGVTIQSVPSGKAYLRKTKCPIKPAF